ncbi:hypothetical protein AC249_AIPGENE17195, partial [Exaiptasia diaphana]
VSSIGVWYNVLYLMMILSMLTNSLIVGFSSEQLASWCPWMYETIDGDQFIKPGYGRYVVAIVFSCEHFLILCAVLAKVLVSDRPKWVRVAIERKNYQLEEERRTLEKLQKLQLGKEILTFDIKEEKDSGEGVIKRDFEEDMEF